MSVEEDKNIEHPQEETEGRIEAGNVPADTEADGPEILSKTPEKDSAEAADFTGQTLKEVRERLGVNLEEIYRETKIRIKTLEDLENEEFEALPPEVYVKGFVKSYAQFLNLDPKITADIYMEKLHSWKYEKRQRHNLPFRLTRKKG